MSSTDTRIVQMQFDNAQFLQGSQQTQDSMTKLKASLNVDGQAASLQNLQDVGNKFSLAGMGEALDSISSKFGAMGAIGFSVLNTITNQALQTGESLLNALVQPLVEGGKQRSLNISQAQFQFQALGLNVASTMASALAAVKGTSYSLDQAALAAANFGASGIKSGDDMTRALTAVSGVAAITGQSYSSIADIFDTVAGDGRLMGEQLLQLSDNGVNAAAVLATSLGKTQAQVRAMVTAGQISFQQFSDAMYNAFGAHAKDADQLFTGALANMQAAAARIGQTIWDPVLEGERRVFNAVSPLLDSINTAVNPLIVAFGKLFDQNSDSLVKSINSINFGVLTAAMPNLVQIMDNVFAAIQNFVGLITKAFDEIFPSETQKELVANVEVFTTAIVTFTKNLDVAGTTANDIKNSFAGFFALIDIGVQIVEAIVNAIFSLTGSIKPAGDGVLSITGSIGLFLVNVDKAIKSGGGFIDFFDTLAKVLKIPIDIISTLVGFIGSLVSALAKLSPQPIVNFGDVITGRFQGLFAFFAEVKNVISDIVGFFEKLVQALSPVIDFVIGLFTTLGQKVGAALATLNFSQALQVINTSFLGVFYLSIRGFFGNMLSTLSGNGYSVIAKFKTIMTQFNVTLKAFEYNLDARTIFTLAAAIALIVAAIIGLTLVNPTKLASALGAISTMLTELVGTLAIMKKLEGAVGAPALIAMALALILVAEAVDILVIAVFALSKIDFGALTKGLGAMVTILGAIVGFAALMSKTSPLLLSEGLAILALAGGVSILANAVVKLAAVPFVQLVTGLGAMAVILGAIAGFNAINKVDAESAISGAGLVLLGVALNLIAKVVEDLGTYSLPALAKGVGTVAVLLATLAGFSRISGFGPSFLITAAGLVVMGAALNIMAGVLESIGKESWTELLKGMLGLVVTIGLMILALSIITPSDLVGAAALLVAAAAMRVVADVMADMAKLSWDQIGRAFTVFAGSLILIVAALAVLGLIGPVALVGAAALLIAAPAVLAIAAAMKIFGSLSWDQIGRALTLLAASFVILALGGVLLLVAAPGFLLFSLALLAMGAGIKGIGTGVLTLAKGLLLLSGAGAAGALAIGLLFAAITKALPAFGGGLAAALISFLQGIATLAPKLLTALVTIFDTVLAALTTLLPKISAFVILMIQILVTDIVTLTPLLVNAGISIFEAFLTGVANNIGEIVKTGIDIIANFLQGIADALPQLADAAAKVVISFISSLATAISENSSALAAATSSLIKAVADGISKAITANAKAIHAAGLEIGGALLAGAEDILKINSPSKAFRDHIMGSVFEGIEAGNDTDRAAAVGNTIGNSIVSGATSSINSTIGKISDAVNTNIDSTPTIAPVLDLTNLTKQAATIPGMLTTTPLALSIGTSTQEAASTAVSVQAAQDAANQNDPTSTETAQTILNYTQNNTSPVALSPVEVYRQTNNQLSKKVKELANA